MPAHTADPVPAPVPRTAIVTGGSRGLGRALVGALAGSGWHVVTDGRSTSALADVGTIAGVQAVPGDVADPWHRRALVEAAREATGRLDLLVNNASTLGESPLPHLERLDPEVAAAVFSVNVVAPLGLVQQALPLLRASGGAVVNVTSDAAVEAYEGWGGYGASKAALEQLSRVLAVEEPALRVWWIDPGDMRTAMQQDACPGEDISDRPWPESVVPAFSALLERQPPSGRYRAADLLGELPEGASR